MELINESPKQCSTSINNKAETVPVTACNKAEFFRGWRTLPAAIIAVNGFHEEIDPKEVLYTALSRAMDLAVIVGERNQLEEILGAKHLRRMERRQA